MQAVSAYRISVYQFCSNEPNSFVLEPGALDPDADFETLKTRFFERLDAAIASAVAAVPNLRTIKVADHDTAPAITDFVRFFPTDPPFEDVEGLRSWANELRAFVRVMNERLHSPQDLADSAGLDGPETDAVYILANYAKILTQSALALAV